MKNKITTFILLLISLFGSVEGYTTEWKSYLSQYQIIAITSSKEKIFAANKNGLFSYQISNGAFETWSRVEGLSDSGLSTIAWSNDQDALIIGYSNGNLDLISADGKLENLADIKNKSSIPIKTINHIYCEGNFAWLSCAFGIVKINLERWEVAETWIIGEDGASIAVNELTSDGEYFWAATANGVFKALRNNPNLQDYTNWTFQTTLPFPQDEYKSIAIYKEKVYTCNNNGKVYAFNGSSWESAYPDLTNVFKIRSSSSDLILISQNKIEVNGSTGIKNISDYGSNISTNNTITPGDALISDSETLWIGDLNLGLVQQSGEQSFISTVPSSPFSNNLQQLVASGDRLYATTVSADATTLSEGEIQRLKGQTWSRINQNADPNLRSIKDITKVIISPSDPDHYWGATLQDGLLAFNGTELTAIYNPDNSPLTTLNGSCKIGGGAYDASGNLWLTNPTSDKQLQLIKEDGTWLSFSYSGIDNRYIPSEEIVVSQSNTKWIVVNKSQLFALRTQYTLDNTEDDLSRIQSVLSSFSNSETTIISGYSSINAIKEDISGQLWIGTEKGVVLYTNPDLIFNSTAFYGIQPSVDLGDDLFHPLLSTENITAIAVDGGNQKWFGTEESGVYLFSKDGTKLLQHFNSDNSPLFSNHINSIAINNESGEVFFATDQGLISWMGNATEGSPTFENLYVWPNPVRETYQGEITIDGLASESIVKIADVTGNLVYTTTSNGGRATWNGKNRKGERVSTGVYLIFCADNEGNNSKVIKLLFIH